MVASAHHVRNVRTGIRCGSRRTRKELNLIRALLVGVVLLLIATFPATYLLMLFFGNVGIHLSYWGTLPLGILASMLIGAAGSRP
jgi:hypothetical protein